MASNKAARIIAALQDKRGQYVHVSWSREVRTLAAHRHHTVIKSVSGSVKTGIDYGNMAANTGKDTGSLPWGQWAMFPWLIEHNGNEYLRLAPQGQLAATYSLDGQPVALEDVAHMLPKSRPSGEVLALTVRVEDVTAVGSLTF